MASPSWCNITDGEVREAIVGTALEPIVQALEAVTKPPLPLAATLPRAIVLAGCSLSAPAADYDLKQEDDERKGTDLCRLNIQTAGGQACNAWCLLVAPSGCGKDIGGVPAKLAAANRWLIGDSGSREGLADAFIQCGNGLLIVSEFSAWLNRSNWQGQSAEWITAAFNQGWFCANMSMRKGQPPRKSRFCFPNIIANIQPEMLRQYADQASIASGFLPRFLITRMPQTVARPSNDSLEPFLKAAGDALKCYNCKLGRVFVPERYLQDIFDEFQAHDAALISHWQRLVNEYGPRLAVMLSVCNAPFQSAEVNLSDDHWNRARVLLRWFYVQAAEVLGVIEDDSAAASLERNLAKIFRYIRRHGPVSKTMISRNCGRGTTSRQREGFLNELISRGYVNTKEQFFSTSGAQPPKEWG